MPSVVFFAEPFQALFGASFLVLELVSDLPQEILLVPLGSWGACS